VGSTKTLEDRGRAEDVAGRRELDEENSRPIGLELITGVASRATDLVRQTRAITHELPAVAAPSRQESRPIHPVQKTA